PGTMPPFRPAEQNKQDQQRAINTAKNSDRQGRFRDESDRDQHKYGKNNPLIHALSLFFFRFVSEAHDFSLPSFKFSLPVSFSQNAETSSHPFSGQPARAPA